MEVIVFPDVCLLFTTHLRTELAAIGDGAVVGTRVPSPRPARFVVLRRVGGNRPTLVSDAATVTVEAWDNNEAAAQQLAQRCRAFIKATEGDSVAGVPVYRIDEFAGPALLPDPASNQPRYTQTLSIHLRGEVLVP